MLIKLIKAESYLSLLIAISLFSILALNLLQWQNQRTQQQLQLYQQQQAILIADNQIDRMLANIACERKIIQNNIEFEIRHCSPTKIEVTFPLGEIIINSSS